ncbi:hypothetical protein Fmac_015676 [Flemingia macrophylla]|uniref:LAGLIDADG homing endonuclease n=1 Tax=Flemingia macrophylla TaxID=520843 RepID=A0ABD1MF91_9FABA
MASEYPLSSSWISSSKGSPAFTIGYNNRKEKGERKHLTLMGEVFGKACTRNVQALNVNILHSDIAQYLFKKCYDKYLKENITKSKDETKKVIEKVNVLDVIGSVASTEGGSMNKKKERCKSCNKRA